MLSLTWLFPPPYLTGLNVDDPFWSTAILVVGCNDANVPFHIFFVPGVPFPLIICYGQVVIFSDPNSNFPLFLSAGVPWFQKSNFFPLFSHFLPDLNTQGRLPDVFGRYDTNSVLHSFPPPLLLTFLPGCFFLSEFQRVRSFLCAIFSQVLRFDIL